MKRILSVIVIVSLLISVLVSCQSAKPPQADPDTQTETVAETETEDQKPSGITYLRKNDNGFDSFSITLYEDGTYIYYETFISSHLGSGTYTLEENILTLTGDKIPTLEGSVIHTYKFEYRGNTIVYLAEESNHFLYVHLPDGAVFERGELQ